MRAFAVHSFEEPPAIDNLPIPNADGMFLIRVKYAGVNPVDYKLIERLTASSRYPFVMGIDFAGALERVPAQERDLRVGDRVFGMARTHGSYAEYTAVAPGVTAEPLTRIPENVTDEQAAALPIPGITALESLATLGVTAGQRFVVMGGAGTVGGYAVQIARSRGAHVIATVRGDADEAHRLGVEEVYDTNAVDVFDALRAAHPHGVDAVLDLVNGKDEIQRDAEILKPGGSLVSTLYAADEAWFAKHQIKAQNISSMTNPLSSPQGLTELTHMLADGTITARISSIFALDDAGALLGKLQHGGLRGKTLIRT
jgi:NADPH:quinone reductase-like Zn-dependent oxidoreductase